MTNRRSRTARNSWVKNVSGHGRRATSPDGRLRMRFFNTHTHRGWEAWKGRRMSIADDEAEKAYPTRYYDGTHAKEQFSCDTDDLQEAYLRGRSAPPTNVEIEAVAKRLCYLSTSTSTMFIRSIVTEEEAEENAWNNTKMCNAQDEWLDRARDLLEIARKAVNE
nr:MAG TPA: hypothetical protein [Caudoviricetes sp.]